MKKKQELLLDWLDDVCFTGPDATRYYFYCFRLIIERDYETLSNWVDGWVCQSPVYWTDKARYLKDILDTSC